MNENIDHKLANIKAKLDMPKELADDKQTLANIKEWDEFMENTRKEMKK
jgi:hypothetical protein